MLERNKYSTNQSDLSLCFAHAIFVGFIMSWLISFYVYPKGTHELLSCNFLFIIEASNPYVKIEVAERFQAKTIVNYIYFCLLTLSERDLLILNGT